MFRSRRTDTCSLVAAAVVVSCGAVHPGTRDPTRAVAPAAGTPLAAGQILPVLGEPSIVDVTADGTRLVLAGSIRAEVTPDGRVRLGADRFLRPLAGAYRAGRTRWIFTANDGALAASETGFLGSLRSLGAIEPGERPVAESPGRVLLVGRDGALRTTDGERPLGPLHGPSGGPAPIDAAFVDAQRGLAVADGGALFVTDDGGSAWRAIDLGGEAAWDVLVNDGRLIARTSGGLRELASDGSSMAPSTRPLAAAHGAEAVTPRVRGAIAAALRVRFPGLLATRPSAHAPDGTTLSIEPAGLAQYDLTGGRQLALDAMPDVSQCHVGAWGVGFGAACPDSVLRIGATGAVRVPLNRALTDVVFSDDGLHAAGTACCDVRRVRARRGFRSVAVATIDAVRTLRGTFEPTAMRGMRARVLSMHNALALVQTMRQGSDDALGLYVVDTDRDTVVRLRLEAAWQGRRVEVRHARITGDGAVMGIARIAPGEDDAPVHPGPALLTGSVAGPLALHALPAGADDADFVDAARGIALGGSSRELYRTADGGRSWQPSPVSVVGSSKPIEPASGATERLACSADGCLVDGSIWFGTRSHEIVAGVVVSGPDEREVATNGDDDTAEPRSIADASPGLVHCISAAAAVPSLLRVPAPATAGRLARTLLMPGVDSVLEEWSVPPGVDARFRWRGADARGAFDGATTAAVLTVRDARNELGGYRFAPRWALWAATRTGALLERGFELQSGQASEVVWAAPHAPLTVLHDVTAFADRLGGRAVVDGAQVLPNGGVAVLVTTHPTDAPAVTLDVVTVLGPEGRVRSRRAFAWRAPRIHALAMAQGGTVVGYASARSDAPRAFEFVALDPPASPRPLPAMAPGAIPSCHGASMGATTLRIAAVNYVPGLQVAAQQVSAPLATTLELSNQGVCIRAVESWSTLDVPPMVYRPGFYMGPARGIQLTAGPDGALAGFLDDGTHTQVVSCTH